MQSGAFRQDLYYRINVIELNLPTLNERREDIPLLAKHFLALIAEEWQLDAPLELSSDASERLQLHNFAGNVRELRNVLERAVTLAETATIESSHLGLPDLNANQEEDTTTNQSLLDTDTSHKSAKNNTSPQTSLASVASAREQNTEQTTNNLHPYRTMAQHYPSMSKSVPDVISSHETVPNDSASDDAYDSEKVGKQDKLGIAAGELPLQGLEYYLQEQEKHLIITALKQTNWNKTQAADLLGTTFRSLRYRMKKLDIAEDQ